MGLVHIYCGDGKGKTSAACGLAVRMAGRGNHVVIARFLKTDDSGEVEILKQIPQIHVLPCEKEFGFVFAMDEETKREAAEYNTELFYKAVSHAVAMCEHPESGADGAGAESEADAGLAEAKKMSGEAKTCLLVLDEIMAAMNYGMVREEIVLEFLQNRPENLEVVLTGRNPSESIAAEADYISEIKKLRHPYEKGISARIGIEY